jgi:hypothetical protein
MSTHEIRIGLMFFMAIWLAPASVTTIPQSALMPCTNYCTDGIGAGIGNIVVMTTPPASATQRDETTMGSAGRSISVLR